MLKKSGRGRAACSLILSAMLYAQLAARNRKFQPDPARIYGSKLSEINCFRQPEHNLFFLQPDPGVDIHGIYIPAVPLSKVDHIRRNIVIERNNGLIAGNYHFFGLI